MLRKIGDRIILIGVAHVLPKSMEEVREVIREEDPAVVGVELCRSRYLNLFRDSSSGDSDGSGLDFSSASILGMVLEFIQERIGKKTGMLPGEEMKTAIREADRVGANVSLIDRDINITLQRVMDRMSIWEKLKLGLQVFMSLFFTGEEISYEDLNEEDFINQLLQTFRDYSESMYNVLLVERNEYMADRIGELLRSRDGKILCVVGAGHIPGLEKELNERMEEEDFETWADFEFEWEV